MIGFIEEKAKPTMTGLSYQPRTATNKAMYATTQISHTRKREANR